MEYVLTKEESERIDLLKLIAIVFVVFIHSYTTSVNFGSGAVVVEQPVWLDVIEYTLSQVIARCGVPLFFLLSAVLLFKKKRAYLPLLKEKARTLLFPYLFWNTVWILVFWMLQSIPFTADYFSGSNTLIKDCDFFDWLKLYGIGAQQPQDYPLWFMRDLMVVTLFYPLLDVVTEKIPKVVLFLSVLLLLIPLDFPFKEALLWTCLGACAVKLSLHMNLLDELSMPVMGLLYGAVAVALVCFHRLNVEVPSLSTAFVFLGIAVWVKITRCIYDHPACKGALLSLSQWVFVIYVAHELTLSCLRKVCFKVLGNDPVIALALYIALPVAVILLCVALGKILQALTPKLYYAVTGGRGRAEKAGKNNETKDGVS